MIIKRTLATSIMSRAIHQFDQCLVGVIRPDQTFVYIDNVEQINQLLHNSPDTILVYNQNEHASQIKDQIHSFDGQKSIQIFQDTKGVFGLRAYHQMGKIQTPVTLELGDDE